MKKQLNYKNEIAIYGLAIGVNRGALLLFMPFITSRLSVIAYGDFNFVQVVMQLLSPFLVFNISTAVMREGAEDYSKGHYIAYRYVRKIVRNTVFLFLLSLILSQFYSDSWLYTYAILLAGIEGLHNIMLALIRTKNKYWDYINFTLIKTLGVIILFTILSHFISLDISNLLQIQISLNIIIYIFYYFKYRQPPLVFSPEKTYLKEIVRFSLLLLPHGLAQWLMSASNRIILKYVDTDYNLGIFSIAFTLAMVGMIINSGIGIVLPQQIIQNYSSWITKRKINEFSALYTLAFLFILNFVLVVIKVDQAYFHFLKYYDEKIFVQFFFIFSGFYLLGFYYYYSNILFYFRKATVISRVTVISSIFSILVTLILTYIYSIIGTAISVFLSYLFYTTFIAIESSRYEEKIKKNALFMFGMQLVSILLFYAIIKLYSF